MEPRLYLIASVLLMIGCKSPIDKTENPIEEPPQIRDSTDITDQNVLRAVYSSYRFPEGFHQEDFNGGSPYYENTVSIYPVNQRTPHWFELSTANRNQAFAWSESSSVNSSYYRKFESERETEKYFEFRRVWESHPSDILLSRVHKADYLDRSMYDYFYPGDTLGIYRKTPVDTSGVRELIEYIWFGRNYNTGGTKALCSYVLDKENLIQYILFSTLVSYGDWNLCDQISVMRSTYSVSKATGTITFKSQVVRSITGHCN